MQSKHKHEHNLEIKMEEDPFRRFGKKEILSKVETVYCAVVPIVLSRMLCLHATCTIVRSWYPVFGSLRIVRKVQVLRRRRFSCYVLFSHSLSFSHPD